MLKAVPPKKVLCIHDLSGMGRCSLSVIMPVLAVMGNQPIALPTVLLSTHTGGLGSPARLDGNEYGLAALEHYHTLDVSFDCIYSGYLGGEAQVDLVERAFALWPVAYKAVDPAMVVDGQPYNTVTPALVARIRALCSKADLILPNITEACLLLDRPCSTADIDESEAEALAKALGELSPCAVVTGMPMGKYVGCAGSGAEPFVIKKLYIDRSFPGTGDLFGAIVTGSLMRGNALSAAADAAAEFVATAIRETPRSADTRYGVWFEPLLARLCPVRDI